MESEDTKTDYQEVVRVWEQKWKMEILEITVRDSYSLFSYMQGTFKPLLKQLHSKCQFHPISQYNLSPYYINLQKNGSITPLLQPEGVDANYEISLDMSMYISICNKTVEAIIL